MTKSKGRVYSILGILLVVFSLIAFAAPFTKNTTFGLAFCFGVFAIALQIYVLNISFQKDGDVKSKFYGFPIARIGVCYLAAQLVVSFVEMLLAKVLPVWVPVVLNVILLAIAVIGCIAADTVRDEITRQDAQLKTDVENMRYLQSLSAALPGRCSDAELKKILQNVADEFRFSDPVSSEGTKELEAGLLSEMNEIQKAVIEGDLLSAKALCDTLLSDLSERNRICALKK